MASPGLNPAAGSPPRMPAGEGQGKAADGGIFNVVIGTAGHIDHGKSALVQALTGIHPDRLKEEQERGITIDLGFAPLTLSNGLRAGIIDVPGHEKFIKNMVAGATGIDFVLLVVAADDSVMAQTREHLQILQLLGVPDGLVIMNKVDLVEPEFRTLVQEEIKELVAGTCLQGKPILQVSTKTGEGIAELRAALERALSGLQRKSGTGPFRMPIQRVFAKEGFGSVITGIPLSGSVAVGDALEVLPQGHLGRVKGLHAYQQKIGRGLAGHSTAINVTGVERQVVVRGMVAATPGIFRAGTLFTARLTHLSDAPYMLKHRAPVRFHAGTAEIMGKVLLLEGSSMRPGEEGFVQLLLEEPTVQVPGDRFILRHQSPMVTLGGGVILENTPRKLKRQDPHVLGMLAERMRILSSSREMLLHLLNSSAGPKKCSDLCAELGLMPAQVNELALQLQRENRLVVLRAGECFAGVSVFEALAKQTAACMEEFFREHPALGAMERPELKQRLERALTKSRLELRADGAWFDDLMEEFARRGILRCEANQVALAGRERKLDARWSERARQAEELWQLGGLGPPEVSEIGAALKLSSKEFKEVLRYLCETAKLVEVGPGIYFHRKSYEEAVAKVRGLFMRAPEWTTSDIRKELGMNRKFVVPLVEYFDRQGLTVRVGDKRRLKESKSKSGQS